MRRLPFLIGFLLTACSSAEVLEIPAAPGTPSTYRPPTVVLPADCPPGEWCWMKGRPMVVSGDRDRGTVFAMGSEGEFLRWETGRWIRMPLPVRSTVRSGWVGNANDVWASDQAGRAWHHDGNQWTDASPPEPIGQVIGAPDRSIWATVGATSSGHGQSSGARLLRHIDGRWDEPAPPHDFCLGGVYLVLSANEVWTAGLTCDAQHRVDTAEVRRFDGTTWQLVGQPIPDQGWFPSFERVGDRVRLRASGLFDWNGSEWKAVESVMYPQDLASDERAHWDGLEFTRHLGSLRCNDVYRLDGEQAWCFGGGQIHALVNGEWQATLSHAYETTAPNDAWGTQPTTIWAGSDTRLAYGTGPEDVFRVRSSTDHRLEYFDGSVWSTILDEEVVHLHGTSAQNVWFAAKSGPYHYDGSYLTPQPIPSELTTEPVTRVLGFDAGTAVAVTEDALLLFDGGWSILRRRDETIGQWTFQSVAGSRLDSLWLARYRIGRPFEYAVDRFDGNNWELASVNVERFAEVRTVSGRPWVHVDGVLQSLETDEPAIPLPVELYDATYWIGDDAVWITTDWQAARLLRAP